MKSEEQEEPPYPMPPCDPGRHLPCIVSRCGGPDVRYWNTCGRCWRQIERRSTGDVWTVQRQEQTH